MYLKNTLGPNGDYTIDRGEVFSPMYHNSNTECRVNLYYYINGNTGEVEGPPKDAAALGK